MEVCYLILDNEMEWSNRNMCILNNYTNSFIFILKIKVRKSYFLISVIKFSS